MLIRKYYFLIIAIAIIIVLALIYFFKILPFPKETQEEIKQEKTNQQLSEEYGFHVSSTAGIYPKFILGKFSKRPSETQSGENLSISIKVEDPDGISIVKLTVIDQKEILKKEINLKYSRGR